MGEPAIEDADIRDRVLDLALRFVGSLRAK